MKIKFFEEFKRIKIRYIGSIGFMIGIYTIFTKLIELGFADFVVLDVVLMVLLEINFRLKY